MGSSRWFRNIRAAIVIPAAMVLAVGMAGVARADGITYSDYTVNDKGCEGSLIIAHNYQDWHDYAKGGFANLVGSGWICSFVLQRSTDGGATWSNLSGFHNGMPDLDETYYYYDGPSAIKGAPNYLARVSIEPFRLVDGGLLCTPLPTSC